MPASTKIGTVTTDRDSGAALLLALVFFAVLSVSSLAILDLTGNALSNTSTLKTQRAIEYATDGAVDAAVQSVRYSSNAYTSVADCTPGGTTMTIGTEVVGVDCSSAPASPPYPHSWSIHTRVIDFYGCIAPSSGVAINNCTSSNALLSANISYNDLPLSGTYSCTGAITGTCGTSMSIESWTVNSSSG